MLEDPWAECTPVPVSEVAKKVQVSTRHRYRLFQRLDQTEDNDGLLDDEEPGKLKCQISGKHTIFHQMKFFDDSLTMTKFLVRQRNPTVLWDFFSVDKKIKIEKEDGEGAEGDVDNPDEIEIESSDEDEDKKVKKKEEEEEPEDEEDVDNWEAYDPKHDPNLEDFDPGEIQEHRYGSRSDTYWLEIQLFHTALCVISPL